jgi:hypothetical protein
MVAVAWMGAMRLSVIAALTGANGTVQLFTPRFWTVSILLMTHGLSDRGRSPARTCRRRRPPQLQRAVAPIFGRKTIGMVVDKCRIRQATKAEAGTIEGLARKLDVDPGSKPATIM